MGQDTSDKQIQSTDEYHKRWLTETEKELQNYHSKILEQTKALLIILAFIFAGGLVLIGYTYIRGSHEAYGVLFFVVLTSAVLAILYMSFNTYKQTLQELSIVYDRILANDKYIVSLNTIEKIQDDDVKKELYKEIVESALKDARYLCEGINENNSDK